MKTHPGPPKSSTELLTLDFDELTSFQCLFSFWLEKKPTQCAKFVVQQSKGRVTLPKAPFTSSDYLHGPRYLLKCLKWGFSSEDGSKKPSGDINCISLLRALGMLRNLSTGCAVSALVASHSGAEFPEKSGIQLCLYTWNISPVTTPAPSSTHRLSGHPGCLFLNFRTESGFSDATLPQPWY